MNQPDSISEHVGPAAPPSVRRKSPEDTIAGCRALAASDLAKAEVMDTVNGRERMELSAASWGQRADLLQRLETSFAKRKALDAAEHDRATAAEQGA